jgi:adenylate cyclase
MARSPLRQLLAELKRRRVYRVAAVYVVVAWVLLQLGNIVVEPLRLPEWTMTMLILLLVLGLPVAVVLAWAFDITPEGVRRTAPLDRSEGESDGAAPSPPHTAPPRKVRTAALVGLGMLIAVLAIGTFAFFQSPRSHPLTAVAADTGPQSLAVLPFSNASPDPENEFFADGVMEDILSHLALVPDFAVVSRTTVMRYKGSPLSLPEIAGELEVRYLLEGSVRRIGDQVRITAQLVDGRTDQALWTDTYDRRLEDIFAVQTEIATSIAGALQAELSRGVAARIERRPTADLEAYDLFLLGRESFHRYTADGVARAIELFQQALERDPDFALARAWLGRSYALYAYNHGAGAHFGDSALVHTRRAAAEQPDLAAAQTALGTALATSGRLAEAQEALERAAELNPSDWVAIANLGLVYAIRGRLDEAIRLTRRSMEGEPSRRQVALTNLGSFHGQLGLREEAVAYVDRALQVDPEHLLAYFLQGAFGPDRDDPERLRVRAQELADRAETDARVGTYAGELFALVGDAEATARVLEPVYRRSPTAMNNALVGALYAWALQETGRPAEAEVVLRETEAIARERIALGDETPGFPFTLVIVHSLRGELDEAFRRLEEAEALGWNRSNLLDLTRGLEALRADPRFQEVYDRIEARRNEIRDRVVREEL